MSNLMVPISSHVSISELFSKLEHDHKIACPNKVSISCKRIYVHEHYEIADHSLSVGSCFVDFMQVLVTAIKSSKSVEPAPSGDDQFTQSSASKKSSAK